MSKLKPVILHLSYDYSKENKGQSTVVVNQLIESTKHFSSPKIISLHRTTNSLFNFKKINEEIISVEHFGLPFGIGLKYNMKRIGELLVKKNLLSENIDYIHAHKLTFEGFIGYNLSIINNIPLIISLRQTDFMVMQKRKDLMSYCKKILLHTSLIFYIAPYMLKSLSQLVGEEFVNTYLKDKLFYLPNIVDSPILDKKAIISDSKFVTILWLNKKAIKRKNLYRLLLAIASLPNKKIELDIIGYGDFENEVKKWIQKLGIKNRVKFLGFIKNEDIPEYLRSYSGFLLPSHSETFGVVYAEALFCGTPILYSKNTGFDEVFNNVGVAVNSFSVEDIAKGIMNILENNTVYRKTINGLKETGELNIFTQKKVSETYKNCLQRYL